MSIYLYVYLSICLSSCMTIYLYVYVSVCLSIYMSMYLYVYVSICLCIYMSIYLYVYLSIYLFIYLSLYLFIYLYVYLSIYLSIYLSNGPESFFLGQLETLTVNEKTSLKFRVLQTMILNLPSFVLLFPFFLFFLSWREIE